MICDASLRLAKSLSSSDGRILKTQREVFNRVTRENWLIIKDFLALHYKFNDRLDTPFWRAAMNDVTLGSAQKYVDFFQEVGPDFSNLGTDLKRDFFTAEGYLVMLVGQKVRHNSPFVVSPEEQATWENFKMSVDGVASNGCTVPEFLKIVRSNGLGAGQLAQQAGQDEANQRKKAKVGDGERVGELNWH
jgi:tryptophan halogenase